MTGSSKNTDGVGAVPYGRLNSIFELGGYLSGEAFLRNAGVQPCSSATAWALNRKTFREIVIPNICGWKQKRHRMHPSGDHQPTSTPLDASELAVRLAWEQDARLAAEALIEKKSQEIFDVVEILGCDYGQGFHIARPKSGNQFARWFESFAEDCKPLSPA